MLKRSQPEDLKEALYWIDRDLARKILDNFEEEKLRDTLFYNRGLVRQALINQGLAAPDRAILDDFRPLSTAGDQEAVASFALTAFQVGNSQDLIDAATYLSNLPVAQQTSYSDYLKILLQIKTQKTRDTGLTALKEFVEKGNGPIYAEAIYFIISALNMSKGGMQKYLEKYSGARVIFPEELLNNLIHDESYSDALWGRAKLEILRWREGFSRSFGLNLPEIQPMKSKQERSVEATVKNTGDIKTEPLTLQEMLGKLFRSGHAKCTGNGHFVVKFGSTSATVSFRHRSGKGNGEIPPYQVRHLKDVFSATQS
nr:uncharacterized protein [uncultured bacterium]